MLKRFLRLMAIIIGSLAVITGVPFNVGMWVQTKLYKGDGEIRNDAIVGIPGYTIDFPPFDPSVPYEASYHLYHVPQRILDNSPYLFLRFHSTLPFLETLAIEKRVSATFHFQLLVTQMVVSYSARSYLSLHRLGRRKATFMECMNCTRASSNSNGIKVTSFMSHISPAISPHPQKPFTFPLKMVVENDEP